MQIAVEVINETTFAVSVSNGTTTTHTVTVPPEYYRKLTSNRVSAATLVEKSFEFLLAREPNTSILRSFTLPIIQRYFSEYEQTISVMLG